MSNQFDTSFIPQQPLLRVEGVKGRHEPMNFALVLALILFFVVLITAGGVYFYARSIDARILLRSQELASLATLDSSKIAEYKAIESRITHAKAVLRDHNTLSVVLALLEDGVADNIGLTKLSSLGQSDEFIMNIEGVGTSYQSIYFQLETWRHISPLVEHIDLDKLSIEDMSGLVLFSANIRLKTGQMKYSNVYQAIEKARKEVRESDATLSFSENTEVTKDTKVNVKTRTP